MRTTWILVLASCTIAEADDYVDRRAAAECKAMSRCYLGEFDSQFSSLDECESFVRDDLEAEAEILDEADCDYQPDEAARCVRRVRQMGCADWVEKGTASACDLVYDCTNGGGE